MIKIHNAASEYFRHLIAEQDAEGLALRILVEFPGTPRADCQLSFCNPQEAPEDDLRVACDGFELLIEAASVAYLDDAELDFEQDRMGGQLLVKAPNIKGSEPTEDAPLEERVQYLLESEINPMVAAHGGRVALIEVVADGTVVLEFGGGCHGCGMVSVTLKDGVERTLMEQIPEITAVRDVTDHSRGENPYYR